LRSAILNGEIKPGEWLRQERLAQEYQVSQMPVREALKELTAEGLLEHVPYRGVRVVEFSPEDISDLYACRSVMEGLAARAAAAVITSEELAQLRDMQTQMKAHLQPHVLPDYNDLNRRFHKLIFSASRRTYLTRTLNQLWDAFPSMLWGNFARTAGQPLPQRDQADIDEHEALIEALERRDGAAAEQIARHHVEESGQHLLSALR
jgi:DNA-binding GntR family transcriptional regulator